MNIDSNNHLKVKIINVSGIISYIDNATMVVMPGADGEIGAMYGHIPMVVELKAGNVSIYNGEKIISTTQIGNAIARINKDTIDIIVD